MKKIILCLFAVFAASSARADTCSSGYYWNSIKGQCQSCGRSGDASGSKCLECVEMISTKYGYGKIEDKNDDSVSAPLCTKVNSDAYYVGEYHLMSCTGSPEFPAKGAGCSTPHCTSVTKYLSNRYLFNVKCQDMCSDDRYEALDGTCLKLTDNCVKRNSARYNGDYGHGYSVNPFYGKYGYYCLECAEGYVLKRYGSLQSGKYRTACVKAEDSTECAGVYQGDKCVEQCDDGYAPQNGVCLKIRCPANCAECDDSGACLKCESGYVLKNGACAVKPKTQVAFCPPDKTLSADLCCCISK